MAFEPESLRTQCNFRLLVKTREELAELARLYESSQSKVIDALVKTYGPALKRDAPK